MEYLEVDINSVFEKHTIPEIKEIQKNIYQEIEKKKEELRVMVGERYRNLIEAADTISDMKCTAEKVAEHVKRMEELCVRLQAKQSCETARTLHGKQAFYAVTTQIKLLVDLPEKLWTAMEHKDYMKASQLYLLAKYIHSNLQFPQTVPGGLSGGELRKLFPIISRQWTAISNFKNLILKAAEQQIGEENLTAQMTSDCLAAMVLLNEWNLKKVLEAFLAARKEVTEQVCTSYRPDQSIRSQLISLLNVLVSTITVIESVFTGENANENVKRKLNSICSANGDFSINLLPLHGTLTLLYLPNTVKQFRPELKEALVGIPYEELHARCSEWLDDVTRIINNNFTTLLQHVTLVKGLSTLRGAAITHLEENTNQDTWTDSMKNVLGRSVLLWDELFQELFRVKVNELITQQLSDTVEETTKHVNVILTELSKTKGEVDHDLSSFVWKERVGDLPPTACWGALHARSHVPTGLTMKVWGFSPRVQEVCKDLDKRLGDVVTDLAGYLGSEDDPIILYLQNMTMDHLKQLISRLKESEGKEACGLMVLGRLCEALPLLCPHLKECIQGKISGKSDGPQNDNRWEEAKGLLKEHSCVFFKEWTDLICVQMEKEFEGDHWKFDSRNMLSMMPLWDSISIEEEGEGGETLTSNIRVPMHPSWPLSELLKKLSHLLNSAGAHTLSKEVREVLTIRCVTCLLDHCQAQIGSQSTVAQTQGLQTYFDVRFALMLLVSKDNKEVMEKGQNLLNQLESFVDPFDLDVFSSHISSNLKKALQRHQTILGNIVSPDRHFYSSMTSASVGNVHNTLPLSQVEGSFRPPLLPIPNTAYTPTLTDQVISAFTQSKKKEESASAKPVRSTAASLLGAMGTSFLSSLQQSN